MLRRPLMQLDEPAPRLAKRIHPKRPFIKVKKHFHFCSSTGAKRARQGAPCDTTNLPPSDVSAGQPARAAQQGRDKPGERDKVASGWLAGWAAGEIIVAVISSSAFINQRRQMVSVACRQSGRPNSSGQPKLISLPASSLSLAAWRLDKLKVLVISAAQITTEPFLH